MNQVNAVQSEERSDFQNIFTAESRCIVWGLQTKAVQSMLDFDYASDRTKPSVAAVVYPFGYVFQVFNLTVYSQQSTKLLLNFKFQNAKMLMCQNPVCYGKN